MRFGTDKSKITRKQSKASKHGHENQKSTKPKPQKPKALANFHLQGPILQFPKVIYNLKRENATSLVACSKNVEPQSDPSPRPSPTPHIPDSIPEVSGGNHGDQAKEIQHLKGFRSKTHERSKLNVITHTEQWMKSVSLQKRLAGKRSLKKNWMQKSMKSKNRGGRCQSETSVHKVPFIWMSMGYMETEDAQDVGRTRDVVNEEKENADAKVSTEDVLSTAQQKVSTDKEKVSTDRPKVSIDGSKEEGLLQTIQQILLTLFGEDETIAQDVEETERPRPTVNQIHYWTYKGPLPKIDLKDKGKKKVEEEDESETESEGIPKAEKKFKQLASDEEMARKLQEDWEIEEERKRLAEEEATNDALIRNYNDIKARLRLIKLLAEALYEKIKRSDEDFIAIGSAEDERMIKEMNEKGIDSSKNESVKEEGKEEEGTKKRKSGYIKMIARKKPRKQSDDDSDDEHRKCLKIVTFEATIDSEIMEKKSVITRLDKVSSPDGVYLVIHRANGNFRAFNYLMEVLHIFDRQDLFHLYELMMEQYSEITLEGYELILWGDLKIMMESSTKENDQSDFWSNQQEWKIITWRLYEACGVCILELEDGIVIHMLVERRYPLSKELLQRMLDLGLEVERESTVALDLIRFIKKQIDEE
ncbi:hypothetical protein Tco_0682300 [Tanacetum coccineum]|uniref:Uncharacterized protein n=1 Tax=Tanacetum coccineum TaxID=301880 RepID=A0ABQ4XSD2_9ASTR